MKRSSGRWWRTASKCSWTFAGCQARAADGLFELLMLAGGRRTVVMCAEVLWWRCHRRLIADVLATLGLPVVHIFDAEKHEPHRLAAPARLVGSELSYVVRPTAPDCAARSASSAARG